ncbi:hypothetical protein B0F90DRAFT_1815367 [Multifurca ochricompacta]|uniref:Uncharacterized protein n=1 Tax=Multifurca ochricompacta TaxID=376703 RepID=A0AAD4QQD9_9AGAM|nr:hypothetical protein B0F90DRAFT_1815367 [Multifurca ochricompacta]
MGTQKLSPQGQRLRTIILAVPIMAATSVVLYRRLVLGEPQRKLPHPGEYNRDQKIVEFSPEQSNNLGERQ